MVDPVPQNTDRCGPTQAKVCQTFTIEAMSYEHPCGPTDKQIEVGEQSRSSDDMSPDPHHGHEQASRSNDEYPVHVQLFKQTMKLNKMKTIYNINYCQRWIRQ